MDNLREGRTGVEIATSLIKSRITFIRMPNTVTDIQSPKLSKLTMNVLILVENGSASIQSGQSLALMAPVSSYHF